MPKRSNPWTVTEARLSRSRGLKNLRSLAIGRSQDPLDKELSGLLRKSTNLVEFCVSDNTFFSGSSLKKSGGKIQSFSLNGCYFLNHEHLIKYLTKNETLKRLTI